VESTARCKAISREGCRIRALCRVPSTMRVATAWADSWAGRLVAALIAVLRAVRLYAFAAWVYLAANSIAHPFTMQMKLTHFANWPHENTFGVACAAASAGAFFALCLIEGPPRLGRRGPASD